MPVYEGRCHCGAIGFRFATAVPPSDWPVRACRCAFCRAHGAACTSDPQGRVMFVFDEASALQRYRFALRTADFLLCRQCGVYLGAVLSQDDSAVATLNTRAMLALGDVVPMAQPVRYGGESVQERCRRRLDRWTPVVASL